MEQLAYALFMMCVKETIPNPHTVEYLPKEQRELIYDYAKTKCNQRVNYFFGNEESPLCADWNTECM